MNLALLGCDPETFRIAEWMAHSREHRMVLLCQVEDWETPIRQLFPTSVVDHDVHGLLHHPDIDAVLVTSRPFDPQREDQLRKLVQAGQTLILTHPATQHLLALELEMIRVDAGGLLLTYLPDSLPSGTGGHLPLGTHVTSEPLPPGSDAVEPQLAPDLQEIVWDRVVSHDASYEQVWKQLARDLLLTRLALGPFRQVSAMAPDTLPTSVSGSSLAQVSAMAKTDQGTMMRWSTQPVRTGAQSQLILKTAAQTSRFLADPTSRAWLPESGPDDRTPTSNDPLHLASWFASWEAALGSRVAALPWETVCQSLVLVDGLEYSLKRGKPVDLRNNLVTEEDAFKGVMAAAGCLLLLSVLGVLLVMSLIEALQLPVANIPFFRRWPVLLVIPLVAFLAFQVLRIDLYRERRTPPPLP